MHSVSVTDRQPSSKAPTATSSAPSNKPAAARLARTQPVLPLRPGVARRQTHDYQRNGTASLSAALNAANGEVILKP